MKAEEYLLKIGFDSSHLPDLFNDDDKSYYTIEGLMEEYAESQLKEEREELKELLGFVSYVSNTNNPHMRRAEELVKKYLT